MKAAPPKSEGHSSYPSTRPDAFCIRTFTPFVGRQNELAQLRECTTNHRLVNVIGPPGIGKTRIARHLVETSPDAVFCDLRGARTAEALVTRVAEQLRTSINEGSELHAVAESVAASLRATDCNVLVLDNFEGLVPAGLDILERWMETVPKSCFLVTSRRSLCLHGEYKVELSPLSLRHAANELSDTARLFVARARAIEPNFVTPDQTTLESIAQRLGGLPLAVELAASQMRRHRPAELLSLLQAGPTIALETHERGADPSHRCLRSAIETSWTALQPHERAALSQLTVCHQGFTLDAARAIVSLPSAPPTLEVLLALRDSSLIHVVTDTEDASDTMRWDMYEAIREYASTFGTSAAAQRHAVYFERLSGACVAAFGGGEETIARARLTRERANLRAAFEQLTAQESGAPDGPATLALSLYELDRTAKPALAVPLLSRALDRIGDEQPALRARLFTARGECHRLVGASSYAEGDFQAARRLTQPETEERAALDIQDAILASWRGDITRARRGLETAAQHGKQKGSPHLECQARISLGEVLSLGFHDEAALTEFQRAEDLALKLGDAHRLVHLRILRACYFVFHSGADNPVATLAAQVTAARELGDREAEALAEQILGLHYFDQGVPERSRHHLTRALELSKTLGLRRHQACTYAWLALLAEEEGTPRSLSDRLTHTASVLREVGDRRTESLALLSSSAHAAKVDSPARGYRLLERGEQTGTYFGDGAIVLLAELQRARIELVESCQPDTSRGSAALRRCARNRADQASRRGLQSSPEARWAYRLLERELAESESGLRTLRVEPNGAAFQLGEANPVQLPNGPVIRRALGILAQQHQRTPGEAMNIEDLTAQCWPGERMQKEAASQRVRQVISRLRRAGLGSMLVRTEAGYLLDPSLEVELATSLE